MKIFFNTEFSRWEVYGPDPVIRAGEPQPEFTSPDLERCLAYKAAVEGNHEGSA